MAIRKPRRDNSANLHGTTSIGCIFEIDRQECQLGLRYHHVGIGITYHIIAPAKRSVAATDESFSHKRRSRQSDLGDFRAGKSMCLISEEYSPSLQSYSKIKIQNPQRCAPNRLLRLEITWRRSTFEPTIVKLRRLVLWH